MDGKDQEEYVVCEECSYFRINGRKCKHPDNPEPDEEMPPDNGCECGEIK